MKTKEIRMAKEMATSTMETIMEERMVRNSLFGVTYFVFQSSRNKKIKQTEF